MQTPIERLPEARSLRPLPTTRHRLAKLAALGLTAILLGGTSGCGGSGVNLDLDGPVDGGKAMGHVRYLVEEIGPRPAGSEGMKLATDYLTAELKKAGFADEHVHLQTWTDKKEQFDLRNVWAEIPAKGEPDPNRPILAFGCHVDTKNFAAHDDSTLREAEFVGAIDGGGAAGILLELARHLQGRDNKVDIWLIFFDGEESVEWTWKNDRAMLGSYHFVRTMMADKTLFPKGLSARMKAFVLLDLMGARDFKIDRDRASSGKLQDLIKAVADGKNVGDVLYKDSSSTTDDHKPFVEIAGVRSALLIDFAWRAPTQANQAAGPADGRTYTKWWHTTEDTLDKMSPEALAFAGNLVWHSLPDLEAFVTK